MGTQPREELKAKQLEKVIYFAANLVVSVDEEQRDADLSELEADVVAERDAINSEMDEELERRNTELEGELESLEQSGAKDSELKALRRQADLGTRRHPASSTRSNSTPSTELGKSSRVSSLDKSLTTKCLWREMQDRWGKYFEGGMGASAIAHLAETLDFDEGGRDPQRADQPARRSAGSIRAAQAEGHQTPQDLGCIQSPRRPRPPDQQSPSHDP